MKKEIFVEEFYRKFKGSTECLSLNCYNEVLKRIQELISPTV